MKKKLLTNQTELYKKFDEMNKNGQANLFMIALAMSDLYIDNYDNKRGTHFPFDMELIKANKSIDKIRELIYNRWTINLLALVDFWLNNVTKELRENFQILADEFTLYDIKDDGKIKQALGIL